jgi:hypothetical protein
MSHPRCPTCTRKLNLIRDLFGERFVHPQTPCVDPSKANAWRAMQPCRNCGKDFYALPKTVNHRPRGTCSDECYAQLRSRINRHRAAIRKTDQIIARMRAA